MMLPHCFGLLHKIKNCVLQVTEAPFPYLIASLKHIFRSEFICRNVDGPHDSLQGASLTYISMEKMPRMQLDGDYLMCEP